MDRRADDACRSALCPHRFGPNDEKKPLSLEIDDSQVHCLRIETFIILAGLEGGIRIGRQPVNRQVAA